MKIFFTLSCLFVCFGIGFIVSWKTKQFPYATVVIEWPKTDRNPAAIKKVYDFSHLQGSALIYATKQRLLEGANLVKDQNDIGVELGHFVIKGEDGQKEFACQRFSRVIMAFEGEGSATAGELPQMEVEGQCEISKDINKMAAVWIPVSRILGEQVADGEFDYRDGHPSKLKFANVSDRWPQTWRLKSVQLIDPSGAYGEVTIPSQELKEMLPKPFLVQF